MCVVSLTGPEIASAADDIRIAALKAAELARFEANLKPDVPTLQRLLHDELEYVHSNGDLDSKASFIDSQVTGKRDYIATVPTLESVRVLGDVAIIRGKAKVTVTDNGQSRDLFLGYTDVWIWKDGRWQMTAWRSAQLPEPPPPNK
jgi:hypothetical protein